MPSQTSRYVLVGATGVLLLLLVAGVIGYFNQPPGNGGTTTGTSTSTTTTTSTGTTTSTTTSTTGTTTTTSTTTFTTTTTGTTTTVINIFSASLFYDVQHVDGSYEAVAIKQFIPFVIVDWGKPLITGDRVHLYPAYRVLLNLASLQQPYTYDLSGIIGQCGLKDPSGNFVISKPTRVYLLQGHSAGVPLDNNYHYLLTTTMDLTFTYAELLALAENVPFAQRVNFYYDCIFILQLTINDGVPPIITARVTANPNVLNPRFGVGIYKALFGVEIMPFANFV